MTAQTRGGISVWLSAEIHILLFSRGSFNSI